MMGWELRSSLSRPWGRNRFEEYAEVMELYQFPAAAVTGDRTLGGFRDMDSLPGRGSEV